MSESFRRYLGSYASKTSFTLAKLLLSLYMFHEVDSFNTNFARCGQKMLSGTAER